MAESCNNDLIFPIITLGVPIVIPLLPIICIITYYYVFDSEQLADEIENHNSFQFDMQIEDYDIMQDPYLDTNNMMAMCAWGTGNKAMALPCDLMVIHWWTYVLTTLVYINFHRFSEASEFWFLK